MHRAIGDRAGEARVVALEGAIALEGAVAADVAQIEAARAAFMRAAALAADVGDAALGATVNGWLGLVDEIAGDAASAAARYDEAIAAHERAGRALRAALTRCFRARVFARAGDARGAFEALLGADQQLADAGGASWERVAEITRAEIAMTEGARDDAAAMLKRAAAAARGAPKPTARSAEVRRALAMAEARLATVTATPSPSPSLSPSLSPSQSPSPSPNPSPSPSPSQSLSLSPSPSSKARAARMTRVRCSSRRPGAGTGPSAATWCRSARARRCASS